MDLLDQQPSVFSGSSLFCWKQYLVHARGSLELSLKQYGFLHSLFDRHLDRNYHSERGRSRYWQVAAQRRCGRHVASSGHRDWHGRHRVAPLWISDALQCYDLDAGVPFEGHDLLVDTDFRL